MTDAAATAVPVVLVCDDTPAKRYVLASWLRRAGYQVVEAETAAQALTVLREQTVDLAVLDVHLPDGSGLDITKAVRSDPDSRRGRFFTSRPSRWRRRTRWPASIRAPTRTWSIRSSPTRCCPRSARCSARRGPAGTPRSW